MVNREKFAVLTTMLMKNKDIDAMNRVAFIGAPKSAAATETEFVAQDAPQGTIVKIDKMCEFSGYKTMSRDSASTYGEDTGNWPRTFGSGMGAGYSFTATKAAAGATGDLWIIDNHEVGYTIDYQQRVTIDPRKFCNEAGRAVSVRKLSKGDFIQISADAFTTAPDVPASGSTAISKKYVQVAANGQLVASDTASAGKDVFTVVGYEPMEFGTRFDDAWILEATTNVE